MHHKYFLCINETIWCWSPMFSNFWGAYWSIRVYAKPFTVDFLWVSSEIIIYALKKIFIWPKHHYVVHVCIKWLDRSKQGNNWVLYTRDTRYHITYSLNMLSARGQQTSLKYQIVNILAFMGHMVSAAPT